MYDLREVYFGLVSNFGESEAMGCGLFDEIWRLGICTEWLWAVWLGSGIDSGTVNFSVNILCIQKYLSFLPNVWQLKTTGVLWERRRQFMFNMLINYCLLFLLKKKKLLPFVKLLYCPASKCVLTNRERKKERKKEDLREREIGRKVPMRVASVCERFI